MLRQMLATKRFWKHFFEHFLFFLLELIACETFDFSHNTSFQCETSLFESGTFESF